MTVSRNSKGRSSGGAATRGRRRQLGGAAAAAVLASTLAACGGGGGGGSVPVLNWYINPDSGGQAEIAQRCSDASNGAYTIETSQLPRESSAQREQFVQIGRASCRERV